MSNLKELRHGIELGVIDEHMLDETLKKYAPPGEEGRLFSEECKNYELVNVLRLDFLNILKIDYMWVFKSLTVLTMTHNKIEVIENLEKLTNLEQLDLSFNCIKKIENLNTLTNIEVLMLNDNKIEVLENLDCLQKLVVLSFSNNAISDKRQVIYLRQLKSLKSISFEGNPCANLDCYDLIKAVLLSIKYVNYSLVAIEDIERCRSQHKFLIKQLEEAEETNKLTENIIEKSLATVQFYRNAFVEDLYDSHLLTEMFECDQDGYLLLNTIADLQHQYKLAYKLILDDFLKYCCDQYYIREARIISFNEKSKKLKEERDKNSKRFLSNYLNGDKKENCDMPGGFELPESNKIAIEQLWEDLMGEEINFFEQLQKIRNQFEEDIENFIQQIILAAKDLFLKWKNIDDQWIIDEKNIFCNIIKEESIQAIEIKYLLSDPEILMDIIEISGKNHTDFINKQKNNFIQKVLTWKDNLINNIYKEQIALNRSSVLEIINLMEAERKKSKSIEK